MKADCYDAIVVGAGVGGLTVASLLAYEKWKVLLVEQADRVGGRAMTFLFGPRSVIFYRVIYILGFFFASFTDTTIVWALSYITIVLMAVPNLMGLLILHKEIKGTIKQYWIDFKREHPGEWTPE